MLIPLSRKRIGVGTPIAPLPFEISCAPSGWAPFVDTRGTRRAASRSSAGTTPFEECSQRGPRLVGVMHDRRHQHAHRGRAVAQHRACHQQRRDARQGRADPGPVDRGAHRRARRRYSDEPEPDARAARPDAGSAAAACRRRAPRRPSAFAPRRGRRRAPGGPSARSRRRARRRRLPFAELAPRSRRRRASGDCQRSLQTLLVRGRGSASRGRRAPPPGRQAEAQAAAEPGGGLEQVEHRVTSAHSHAAACGRRGERSKEARSPPSADSNTSAPAASTQQRQREQQRRPERCPARRSPRARRSRDTTPASAAASRGCPARAGRRTGRGPVPQVP